MQEEGPDDGAYLLAVLAAVADRRFRQAWTQCPIDTGMPCIGELGFADSGQHVRETVLREHERHTGTWNDTIQNTLERSRDTTHGFIAWVLASVLVVAFFARRLSRSSAASSAARAISNVPGSAPSIGNPGRHEPVLGDPHLFQTYLAKLIVVHTGISEQEDADFRVSAIARRRQRGCCTKLSRERHGHRERVYVPGYFSLCALA